MKNPTLVTIALVSTCCIITASNAAEHQWEIDLGSTIHEGSRRDQPNLDYNVSSTYYFNPINTNSKYPIEEIAFAERTGEANFSFQSADSSSKGTSYHISGPTRTDWSYKNSSNSERIGLGGKFRSKDSPHVFALELSHYSYDYRHNVTPNTSEESYQRTIDNTVFLIGYDYYISDSLTIGAFGSISDVSSKSDEMGRAAGIFNYDWKDETIGLKLAKLWDLNLDNWIRLDLELVHNHSKPQGIYSSFARDDFSVVVDANYYFNKKTSIGAGLTYNFDNKSDTYQGNFTRHINDQIKLGLIIDYDKRIDIFKTEGRIGFKF